MPNPLPRTQVRLLRDDVLLELVPPPTMQGDLHLPPAWSDDRSQWIVVGVSPKVQGVKVGDRVLAPMLHGGFVDVGNGQMLVSEKRLLAKWSYDEKGEMRTL